VDEIFPEGGSVEPEYWPIGTQQDRLNTMAGLIRRADHSHDTGLRAMHCLVARLHEDLLASCLVTTMYGDDETCYSDARQTAATLLDGSSVNVREVIMLGEAASLYAAMLNGEPVPDTIINALREA